MSELQELIKEEVGELVPDDSKKTLFGEEIPQQSKIHDGNIDKYLNVYAKTNCLSKAARAIGVNNRTVYFLRERSKRFVEAEKHALESHIDRIYQAVVKEVEKGDATNGLKLLAKLDPARFGDKVTVEHNHNLGVMRVPVGESQLERIQEYAETDEIKVIDVTPNKEEDN